MPIFVDIFKLMAKPDIKLKYISRQPEG
jgi:hypothetical protein